MGQSIALRPVFTSTATAAETVFSHPLQQKTTFVGSIMNHNNDEIVIEEFQKYASESRELLFV
jgi:hypothetical protein